MADVVYVSSRPIWYPLGISAAVSQPIDQVVDVGTYDAVDVVIQTYKLGGSTPILAVSLFGALQCTQDDGSWGLNPIAQLEVAGEGLTRCTLGSLSGAVMAARYLRWQLAIASGSISALALDIAYIGRGSGVVR